MKPLFLPLALVLILGCTMSRPETGTPGAFRVAFYNVENLYDTIDNPLTDDDWFLPISETRWDSERYWKKIHHLARVIQSMSRHDGVNAFPDLVGLAEIENREVLADLVADERIRDAGYAYVHEESPDERGADVALLYRKGIFAELGHKTLAVHPGGDDRTRDILYVEGVLGGTKLHVFVNHWPSRREGRKESEPKRLAAATVLREAVGEILAVEPDARILIMGDFNDEPGNSSIRQVLGAGIPGKEAPGTELLNLSYKAFSRGEGTYYYRYEEDWNMLDQFIVSANMVNDTLGLHCPDKGVNIHREEFLLFHMKGEAIPNRTYSGSKYHGGYSDHLPVYIDLSSGQAGDQ